jgi:hypothetical protein
VVTSWVATTGAIHWLAASAPPAGRWPYLTRRAAQQLARRELSRSIYGESLSSRILGWIGRLLGRLFVDSASLPGGWWTTVCMLAALVALVAWIAFSLKPAAPRRGGHRAVLADTTLSARAHREIAERRAENGDYSEAIIERMRAIAVEVEERGILRARPGRTADEFAAEAGLALPAQARALTAAALLFDDVRYGGRDGTQRGYQSVRDLDTAVQATKAAGPMAPVVAGQAAAGVP